MKRQWLAGLMLVTAAALGSAGCSDRSPVAPVTPAVAPQADLNLKHFKLFHDADESFTDTRSAWISSFGGFVIVDTNILYVPPKAVAKLTKFTFTVSTSPFLVAHLTAVTADGKAVTAFPVPLTLVLSYRYVAKSVPDPSKLVILWVVNGPNGPVVPQTSTVNTRFQTITASIRHFSDYSPGVDDLAGGDLLP